MFLPLAVLLANDGTKIIMLTNPVSIERDEVIVIKNEQYPLCLDFENDHKWVPICNGEIVPYQYVDSNNDGKNDMLYLMVKLNAKQSITCSFQKHKKSDIPVFPKLANIRLARKVKTDGITQFHEVIEANRLCLNLYLWQTVFKQRQPGNGYCNA